MRSGASSRLAVPLRLLQVALGRLLVFAAHARCERDTLRERIGRGGALAVALSVGLVSLVVLPCSVSYGGRR